MTLKNNFCGCILLMHEDHSFLFIENSWAKSKKVFFYYKRQSGTKSWKFKFSFPFSLSRECVSNFRTLNWPERRRRKRIWPHTHWLTKPMHSEVGFLNPPFDSSRREEEAYLGRIKATSCCTTTQRIASGPPPPPLRRMMLRQRFFCCFCSYTYVRTTLLYVRK